MTSGPIVVLTPSADQYGSDRSLAAAMPALRSFAPVVVLSAQDGPTLDVLRDAGADVRVMPDFAVRRRYIRPLAVPALAWRLSVTARAARRIRLDDDPVLVYTNTLAVGITRAARRLFGAPQVLHVREKFHGAGAITRLHVRPSVRAADVVIGNSRDTAAYIEPFMAPGARLEVVYNGVDIPDDPLARLDPASDRPLRINCVGRIHPKKGQEILLEAVIRSGRPWELHLYGDALPEHRHLESALRSRAISGGVEERVHFHGFVSGTADLYREADVAVVPSVRPEEFSRVSAEAQVRGLPAIVTGPGGVAEVVAHDETGLVVAPGDVDDLLGALLRLDDDRALLARFGAAGAARMREHFSTARYESRMAEVIAAALGRPPPSDSAVQRTGRPDRP